MRDFYAKQIAIQQANQRLLHKASQIAYDRMAAKMELPPKGKSLPDVENKPSDIKSMVEAAIFTAGKDLGMAFGGPIAQLAGELFDDADNGLKTAKNLLESEEGKSNKNSKRVKLLEKTVRTGEFSIEVAGQAWGANYALSALPFLREIVRVTTVYQNVQKNQYSLAAKNTVCAGLMTASLVLTPLTGGLSGAIPLFIVTGLDAAEKLCDAAKFFQKKYTHYQLHKRMEAQRETGVELDILSINGLPMQKLQQLSEAIQSKMQAEKEKIYNEFFAERNKVLLELRNPAAKIPAKSIDKERDDKALLAQSIFKAKKPSAELPPSSEARPALSL